MWANAALLIGRRLKVWHLTVDPSSFLAKMLLSKGRFWVDVLLMSLQKWNFRRSDLKSQPPWVGLSKLGKVRCSQWDQGSRWLLQGAALVTGTEAAVYERCWEGHTVEESDINLYNLWLTLQVFGKITNFSVMAKPYELYNQCHLR